MLSWKSVSLTLMIFLLIDLWLAALRHDLFELGVDNQTEMPLAWLQQHPLKSNNHCWQTMQCNFVQLIFHSLVTLLVYNLVLILIGWHLHKSVSCRAERMILVIHPITRKLEPAPLVLATTQETPPLRPARSKRRTAPKPPPRRLRNTSAAYPSQNDPFSTVQVCCYPDQYESLRRNLNCVLEGLQQSAVSLSFPRSNCALPLPLCNTSRLSELSSQSSSTRLNVELPKHKAKSRKLFRKLLKRLAKPFGKKVGNAVCISRSNNNINNSCNKNGMLHPIWRCFKLRSGRKQQFELQLPSSSSSESNCSSFCLYAH
ncbi:uncharacterized protein LOC116805711 [Drosophila grimshawi]|uniref:uncharacterized protein LOC116805711 n=1 Tax=Drosophila grimshawi TaxID=7222 RepID=UPI000C86F15A|nr:uncharacterized protein LOC116805711 [Drosophila grimshawi]